MPPTLESTSSLTAATLAATAAQIEGTSARLLQLLSFVPDERLDWAPATTSRSALRLAAHCALTNRGFAGFLSGRRPEIEPAPDTFFTELRAAEREFATRDEVAAAVRDSTAELVSVIRAIDDATIDAPRSSPFGSFPTRFWLDQSAAHLAAHTGQLAYLQTIWGDLDDHMG